MVCHHTTTLLFSCWLLVAVVSSMAEPRQLPIGRYFQLELPSSMVGRFDALQQSLPSWANVQRTSNGAQVEGVALDSGANNAEWQLLMNVFNTAVDSQVDLYKSHCPAGRPVFISGIEIQTPSTSSLRMASLRRLADYLGVPLSELLVLPSTRWTDEKKQQLQNGFSISDVYSRLGKCQSNGESTTELIFWPIGCGRIDSSHYVMLQRIEAVMQSAELQDVAQTNLLSQVLKGADTPSAKTVCSLQVISVEQRILLDRRSSLLHRVRHRAHRRRSADIDGAPFNSDWDVDIGSGESTTEPPPSTTVPTTTTTTSTLPPAVTTVPTTTKAPMPKSSSPPSTTPSTIPPTTTSSPTPPPTKPPTTTAAPMVFSWTSSERIITNDVPLGQPAQFNVTGLLLNGQPASGRYAKLDKVSDSSNAACELSMDMTAVVCYPVTTTGVDGVVYAPGGLKRPFSLSFGGSYWPMRKDYGVVFNFSYSGNLEQLERALIFRDLVKKIDNVVLVGSPRESNGRTIFEFSTTDLKSQAGIDCPREKVKNVYVAAKKMVTADKRQPDYGHVALSESCDKMVETLRDLGNQVGEVRKTEKQEASSWVQVVVPVAIIAGVVIILVIAFIVVYRSRRQSAKSKNIPLENGGNGTAGNDPYIKSKNGHRPVILNDEMSDGKALPTTPFLSGGAQPPPYRSPSPKDSSGHASKSSSPKSERAKEPLLTTTDDTADRARNHSPDSKTVDSGEGGSAGGSPEPPVFDDAGAPSPSQAQEIELQQVHENRRP